MKKNLFMTTAITALFLITVGVNSTVAMDDGGEHGDSGQNEHQMDHSGIQSGSDFGKHVSEHARSEEMKGGIGRKGFSGDHNPGKHQGYSGIKND